MCDNIGISPSAVQKHIDKLKREKVISRVDVAKGGSWEIIQEELYIIS